MNIKKINTPCYAKLITKTMILLFGIIGYGPYAFAVEDGKVYPGSNCHYGANTPSTNVKYDSTGFIYNNSTTNSALISCPIVKDKVFSAAGLNLIKIRYKKAVNSGFRCEILSRNRFGSPVGFQKSKWDFGPPGVKTMTLDDMGGFSRGVYTLSCILPPSKAPVNAANRSGIYNYRIHEK